MRAKSAATTAQSVKRAAAKERPRCGLCGKRGRLTKTECCGQWICDDQDSYVLFSYARNSCSRNHERYTLCGYHFGAGHKGSWQDCKKCRKDIDAEMYAHYGTNKYNFEKLADPPPFDPTRCGKCSRIIKVAEEGYSMSGKTYTCSDCFSL